MIPLLRPAPRAAAGRKTLNLVFVHHPRKVWYADIEAIADRIGVIAPEIKIFGVMADQTADVISSADWQRPSITVSFGPVGRFIPPRGPVFENRPVPKLEQFRALRMSGVPTPHTAPFRPGMALDPADWGDFVMLKPAALADTSNGRNLQVFRTAALSGRELPAGHPARNMPMLVQQWIDTGRRLTAYRCLTLFGAALYVLRSDREDERPPLDAPDGVIEAMPAEADRGRNFRDPDQEIMAFAARMAAAFPRHPVLGCDVLREAGTGRLFAIEVNAGGNVWHFSSLRTARWRSYERTHSLKTEFSSFETAAQALAGKTRQEAR